MTDEEVHMGPRGHGEVQLRKQATAMTPDEIALDQNWASTEAREIVTDWLERRVGGAGHLIVRIATALRAAEARGYERAREQAAGIADGEADEWGAAASATEIAAAIRKMEPEG